MAHYQSPLRPVLPAGPDDKKNWGRLQGCSKALALAAAAQQGGRWLALITNNSADALRFNEEIRFFLGNADLPVLSFPDWETLPYDNFSPYQDIISERLATLTALQTVTAGIVIAPIATLMHRLLPVDYLKANSLQLAVGQRLSPAGLRARLGRYGYRHVDQTLEHGDIAVRGSIIDLFPMGSGQPIRLDFLDDEIDSIRLFDIDTQRSVKAIDSIAILPARETPLGAAPIETFRRNWRAYFAGDPNAQPTYAEVSQGNAPAGIEYYLPFFYDGTSLFFDYLAADAVLLVDEGAAAAAADFWAVVAMRYGQARDEFKRPALAPKDMFIHPDALFNRMDDFAAVYMTAASCARQDDAKDNAQENNAQKNRTQKNDSNHIGTINFASRLPLKLPVDVKASVPFALFNDFVAGYHGRILLVAETTGRRQTIMALLARQGDGSPGSGLTPRLVDGWPDFLQSDCRFALTVAAQGVTAPEGAQGDRQPGTQSGIQAAIQSGALLDEPAIAIISEAQLFGERVSQQRLRRRKQQLDGIVKHLAELAPGAPVVHSEHGVGRYQGLKTLQVGEIPAEFIQLEYAGGDKLYVPVSSLELISRFTGADPEHAPLHRLGSGHWQKARRKAAQKAHDVAVELLEMHARRAARQGYAFEIDENAYQSFAQGFPFEETPGQAQAIDKVLADMRSSTPMDRLICGDAGFGKTEVALRAAFIAVQNNKQVALLAPTTLLAQQHYQNFADRLADWPLRVAMLSRFVGIKDQTETLAALKEGRVDIVIGTHKLLQDTVAFKALGLLIIDEEHRFGVRQKERFKALRAEVDVLTLTATPIPRTLNMALSELRSLSIIATPPARRLAVKTFISEWTDSLLKEALLRELKRGGQAYFLHNEVQSIEKMAERIARLMPEARLRIAHGQLPERRLEQVMQDFYHRRFHILLCTTIIESGIDVPNANTIIINRADRFGLAQLYQLRGRVGRSHHRAYAYLLTPDRRALSRDAGKRLEAIGALEDLGVGFTLATHDLEIRGAGELLGEEQSGQIQEVGFGMYMDLLGRAIQSLRAGRQPALADDSNNGVEINLHAPALIPADYVPDIHTRLVSYKRVASAQDEQELGELTEEFIDRFGLLPAAFETLLQAALLKLRARPLGVRKIDMGKNGGRIWFHAHAAVEPAAIIRLVSALPNKYKLDGARNGTRNSAETLRILSAPEDVRQRIALINECFDALGLREAA